MKEFLIALLAAVTLQNILFTRGLGANPIFSISRRSYKTSALFCCFMVYFMLSLTVLSFWVSPLLENLHTAFSSYVLRPIVYLLILTIIFAVTCFFLSKLFFDFFSEHEKTITSACFNCAVFGTVLLTLSKPYSFLQSLGYASGACIGFILALVIVSEGQRRIELSPVPKSFKGLPVSLIYIGLISLAVYGLVGHQLPA